MIDRKGMYEKHFQESLDRLTDGNSVPGPDLLAPSSEMELLGIVCRELDQYGLYIGYTVTEEDDVSEDFAEWVCFDHRIPDKKQDRIELSLEIQGFALLFFDDHDEVKKFYNEIPEQKSGNPFYAATIHKRGIVLTENT